MSALPAAPFDDVAHQFHQSQALLFIGQTGSPYKLIFTPSGWEIDLGSVDIRDSHRA